MAKPENRWQLLLVADDGRIVPFKRIKGIALTLAFLSLLLGLLCAGLGWQWTAEKVRHRKTKDLLVDANRRLNHYKSEVELITAELVLAEVRMEGAGLPVTKRRERALQQPDITAAAEEAEQPAEEETTAEVPAPQPEKEASTTPQETAESAEMDASGALPTNDKEKEKPATVALGDLTVKHDTQKKVLMARFRIKNIAPGSSKVAGKSVVVLRSDSLNTDFWQALPKSTLVDGIPDGKTGRAFQISRFVDMELMAPAETDPSVFDTARVYVFGSSGDVIVEKDYPITLSPPVSMIESEAAKPSTDLSDKIAVTAESPEKAPVGMTDPVLTHDAGKKTLTARFRVKNLGDRSAPVAGRCVVVLKTTQDEQASWLTMPRVKMVNGRPEGNQGQAFRISRFRDMEIEARGVADPSVYESAIVYVFDTSGNVLLKETIPVTLPAPPAETVTPTPPTEGQSETTGKASEGEAAAHQDPAAVPVEDPSLTEAVEPAVREDDRARF